jgi:Peroxide stress protein YaaA
MAHDGGPGGPFRGIRPKSYAPTRACRRVPPTDLVVLIPESTRKRSGGSAASRKPDAVVDALPAQARKRLEDLREEVLTKSSPRSVDPAKVLPAYERFDGNMYRSIPRDAWEERSPAVEVIIASGLQGLVASRDPIPAYKHSMAESTPPFGKLNRWWHGAGLPDILAAYLTSVRPKAVVDLLSLEYREAVAGFENRLSGVALKRIDFPGMGRGSQPLRGEKVAEILRTGRI